MSSSLVDRVRSVIERVADSQAAFGAKVGISKDKLSKSLAGSRRFTSLELAVIAEVGGVTVDWLLTGRTPVRPALAARASAAEIPHAADIAELTDWYAAAFDVLELLERQLPTPKLPASPGGVSLRDQGSRLAAMALDRFAERGFEAPYRLRIGGLASAIEQTFGIDVAIAQLPSALDGLAWQTDHRRLILLASTEQWTRQRFTAAHELGHILAGDAQQLVVDKNLAPGIDRDPGEVRANWFAAAMLMPEAVVRSRTALDDRGFAELVVELGVSPSALAVRLRTLGLIDGAHFERVRGLTSVECHRTVQALDTYIEQVNAALGGRLPTRLVGALLSAYHDGETTLRPLANLLGVDLDDLRETVVGTGQSLPIHSDADPVYYL